MRIKSMFFMTAVALASAAVISPAQALVIGTADSSSGLPFGGNSGYYFQQIYSASAFTAPMSINSLTFYNTVTPGGTPNSGTFRILLSTTTYNDIAGFDTTNFGANGSPSFLPAGAVEVYNATAPVLAGGQLVFNLSNAYNYDPAAGNLVMTVFNLNLSTSPTLFLDADKDNPAINFRFSSYNYNFNQGLVTGFNAGAVPEPATWALMIGGFALVGAGMRRKTQAVRFA